MSGISTGFAVVALVVAVSAQERSGSTPGTPRTVWDGVYTSAQAERGKQAYHSYCARCHRDDLSGYNDLLRGQRFMEKYREAPLHLFFDKTRATMPRDAAGTLSDQIYADIVTYVLQVNEFPAGSAELRVEDMPQVRLINKGGPEPVPNFSLVQVFGCLTRSGSDWLVTGATEPVRTGLPQPAEGELAGLKPGSGQGKFELLSYHAYSPEKHADRTVEVRGFLIRRPAGDRLNVTSIGTVGPACAQ
jgi:mono/diheme cytochrome c family protein